MGGAEPDPAHPLTLGTAGHIDHGKTALVKALTGVDTDRLEEEQRRGISIALGYAPLELPSGRRLSVVDVPGHERFVRTMVAGATGIDLFLMVVAADDGVMPQTREHAAVLRGLGVSAGVVAVTKCDLREPSTAEITGLFPGLEVVPCSTRTGVGIDGVKVALDRVAGGLRARPALGDAVLHVDRVFTIRGAGTVVTGTLWSGAVARGDSLSVLPAGLEARVRSVQVHDEDVESAGAGQRVAVNLVGVDRDEIHRGDVLASADAGLAASFILDVELDVRIEHGTRVTVHHGTRETPARVAWLGGRFHQLRCEQPLVAAWGDRLVIRSIAPPDTLGGGVVLDPAARKHGPSRELIARLERLSRGETADVERGKAADSRLSPPKPIDEAAIALEQALRDAGLAAPAVTDVDAHAFAALRAHGRAQRVGKLAFHADVLAEIEQRVRAIIDAEGAITLARLRDDLDTSRKYAQALLEHFDAARVTRRREDDSPAFSGVPISLLTVTLHGAVLGLGMIGRHHARLLQASPRTTFAGAVDPDGDRFGAVRDPALVFATLDDLLAAGKPDFVIVAVPTDEHLPIARTLAPAGIHLLVEKPLAATEQEAAEIVSLCAEHGIKGAVGHVERFNPALQELRHRVDGGQLGQVFTVQTTRVGPFPDRVRDVGVVKDLATHDLDIVRWIGGAPIATLAAQTQHKTGREHEDLVLMTGSLENGVSFNSVVDWLTPTKARFTRVLGEGGMLEANTLTDDLTFSANGTVASEWGRVQALRGVSEGDVTRYALTRREPLLVELEAFCDLVAGDPAAQAVPLEAGLEAVRYAEAALASAEGQTTVKL